MKWNLVDYGYGTCHPSLLILFSYQHVQLLQIEDYVSIIISPRNNTSKGNLILRSLWLYLLISFISHLIDRYYLQKWYEILYSIQYIVYSICIYEVKMIFISWYPISNIRNFITMTILVISKCICHNGVISHLHSFLNWIFNVVTWYNNK